MSIRGEKGIRCKTEAASTYCKGDERTLIPLTRRVEKECAQDEPEPGDLP